MEFSLTYQSAKERRSVKISRLVLIILVAVFAAGIPARAQESITDLVQKVKPSVVTVTVYDKDGKEESLGTGFFVDESHVITCFHVIDGAARAEVKSASGGVYKVKGIAGSDQITDIARLVLEVPATGTKVLTLAKAVPKEGERIVVVGSPLGLELTVTEGIVSAVREIPGMGKVIQLTAAISPGSSGSPVMNLKGEVVGVVTSYLTEGQSLNFAVSSQHISKLKTSKLVAFGKPKAGKASPAQSELSKGIKYYFAEEYDKALPLFQAATKNDPTNAIAWYGLGSCLDQLGRYDDAIAAYKQAISIDPDDAYAHYGLGYAYGELGRNDDAIAAYKQAIRIDPDLAPAHYNLGVAYSKLGRNDDAIAAYKQAIRIDPDYALAHYGLGRIFGELGRNDDQIAAYKQAIRIDSDYALAHFNLGLTYLITGDQGGALNEYKILKKLNPEKAKMLFDLIYK